MPNEQNNEVLHTAVLIVGGGMTGVSAALFLLDNGITPVLIEKHAAPSIHPRSRGFDVRTMELFRELSLTESITEAGKALAHAWGILKEKNLKVALEKHGETVGKMVTAVEANDFTKSLDEISPARVTRCTQDIAEPLLLQAAKARGATIFFSHELQEFEQTPEKITALVKDKKTGRLLRIAADYMIAADGAKSKVRSALQLETTGRRAIADFLNVYFEADLAGRVKGREFSLLLIEQPEVTGIFTTINSRDKWVFQLRYYPGQGQRPEDYDNEKIVSLLRKVIGDGRLKIKIISVMPWQMGTLVVKNMQQGNIFIAGDAAHKMTPFGGKGANTGVQDAHNLSWKLAAVIKGYGQKSLLQTYSAERQSVGEKYARLSGELADEKGLIRLDLLWSMKKEFIGIADYLYRSGAIIGDAHQEGGRCFPGALIPHLWLDTGKKRSTIDLPKNRFLLLALRPDAGIEALSAVLAGRLPIPLGYDAFDNQETRKKWEALTGMGEDEVLLVRPDGFIAWRGLKTQLDLEKVLQQILAPVTP